LSVCKENIFKNIFQEWSDPLQRFALSKGIDLEQIPDLIQEAFLRLWRNCEKVSKEKAGSYLFKTINNLNIDAYRKSQSQLKYTSSLQSQVEKEDGQYQLEMKEFEQQLAATIAEMTESAREVFILHRFDGKSYKEIATLLNIGIKAVEKRMHKALIHLSKKKINLRRR